MKAYETTGEKVAALTASLLILAAVAFLLLPNLLSKLDDVWFKTAALVVSIPSIILGLVALVTEPLLRLTIPVVPLVTVLAIILVMIGLFRVSHPRRS